MPALYFIPPRGPFIDPITGELTRAAVLFLRGLFERVGGSDGSSTNDLSAAAFEDAGVEETKALLYRLADDLSVSPLQPLTIDEDDDGNTQRIVQLEAQVAELRKDLEALRVGTLVL